MSDVFIGGGKNNASRILKILPLAVSLLCVIISLGTMPGTIGHKTKFVRKDDPENELKLSDISIPVVSLSFTIILIITGIILNMSAVKEYIDTDAYPNSLV
jgi:hypothetical protein